MAALAERRIIPARGAAWRDPRMKSEARARVRRSCGCSRRLLFAASEPLDEKTLGARLPEDVDVQASAARAADRVCAARRQPRPHRRQVDVPHRQRSVVAADPGGGGAEEAVARRDRDARDHRLSPAGDARRGRGDPRRRDVEGHLRRAAGDRLDPAARPPQGAGPADHLRHDRGFPVAFRPRGARPICRASTS